MSAVQEANIDLMNRHMIVQYMLGKYRVKHTYRHTKGKQPRCIRVVKPRAREWLLTGGRRPVMPAQSPQQTEMLITLNTEPRWFRVGALYHHATLGTVRLSSIHPRFVTVRDRLGYCHDVEREELHTDV